ncbi:MAG: LysM peptidoglycan-binding domain-containing protein, partial [Mesorhizobium sp.]
ATPPAAAPATDAGPQVAAANPEPAPAQPALPAKPPVISVKAVEIEGNKVFVAGVAPPGGLVRAYANDIMLGETKASPTGEFLVETIRELAIGDYIVRADLIAPNGKDVVARAQVPFSRIEGESIAAVAPPAAAPVATAPQNDAAPAQVAAAPAANGDTAAPLQAVKNGVIIRRGDSLWRISRRVYGHGVRYSTIYLANTSQISDPDRIWPGQIFSVPEKTEQGESADMDAIGDQKTTVEPQAAGSAADASAGKVIQ